MDELELLNLSEKMHTTTSSCCICLFTAASIDTDLIQSIRNVIVAMDHRRHNPTHHLFQQHLCTITVSCRHCIQHVECPVAECKSSSRCRHVAGTCSHRPIRPNILSLVSNRLLGKKISEAQHYSYDTNVSNFVWL